MKLEPSETFITLTAAALRGLSSQPDAVSDPAYSALLEMVRILKEDQPE